MELGPHRTYLQRIPSQGRAFTAQLELFFADTQFAFGGLSDADHEMLSQRYLPLGHPQPNDETRSRICIDVTRVPSDAFQTVPTLGWEYVMAIDHQPHTITLSGLGFFAQIQRDTLHAEIRHTDAPLCTESVNGQTPYDLVNAIENVFRVLVVYQLLRRGSLVLHSAALAEDGHAYVCFGKSGAGKTTLCRLSDQAGIGSILSDELNALEISPSGVDVLAMPFAGDFGGTYKPGRHPLAGLYALEQGNPPQISACTFAQGFSRLLAACPYVNTDPYSEEQLFASLQDLLARQPLQVLRFAKDTRFWGMIRDARAA